jgi:hypothetical protein
VNRTCLNNGMLRPLRLNCKVSYGSQNPRKTRAPGSTHGRPPGGRFFRLLTFPKLVLEYSCQTTIVLEPGRARVPFHHPKVAAWFKRVFHSHNKS